MLLKLLQETVVFFTTMGAGIGLIYGSHTVLANLVPSWLVLGIAVFGTMFVTFFLTAQASAPVLNGSGRGAIIAAIASVFMIGPDGSGVLAGVVGMILGIAAGMVTSGRRASKRSVAAPERHHAGTPTRSGYLPPQQRATCDFCGGQGLVGARSTSDGRVDYLPNDGNDQSFVRLPCPFCDGGTVRH